MSAAAAPPETPGSMQRFSRSTSLQSPLDAEAQPLPRSPRSPTRLSGFVARVASAVGGGSEKHAYTRLGGDKDDHPLRQRPLGRLLATRPRRRLVVAAAAGVVLLLLLLVGGPRRHHAVARENQSFATSMRALTHDEARDRTWGTAKCRREFPAFYPQLEELQRRFQAQGGISKQMLDASEKGPRESRWGLARLIIHDGQIFIRRFSEGEETRVSTMIGLLHSAIVSTPTAKEEPLPSIDMVIGMGDFGGLHPDDGTWALTRAPADGPARGWLLPDFGFASWTEAGTPSYEEFRRLAADVERATPWEKKDNRAFWRGFPNVYELRNDLMSRTNVSLDPQRAMWTDVVANGGGSKVPAVRTWKHCEHKYLIHTEGNSYSGRSKYLFGCRSVVIVHRLWWTQHFHPALVSDPRSRHQNHVELKGRLFDGLEESMAEMWRADGRDAPWAEPAQDRRGWSVLRANTPEQIAANAERTLAGRYLTPAATACYTRAALRAYAASQNVASWGPGGPGVRPDYPAGGIEPGTGKYSDLYELGVRGDLEVATWRQLGSPEWPPMPRPKPAPANNTMLAMLANATALANDTKVLAKGAGQVVSNATVPVFNGTGLGAAAA